MSYEWLIFPFTHQSYDLNPFKVSNFTIIVVRFQNYTSVLFHLIRICVFQLNNQSILTHLILPNTCLTHYLISLFLLTDDHFNLQVSRCLTCFCFIENLTPIRIFSLMHQDFIHSIDCSVLSSKFLLLLRQDSFIKTQFSQKEFFSEVLVKHFDQLVP